MFFDLFLYNESVMISSLNYNVFNIHIKYKVSRIKNTLSINAFGNVLNNNPPKKITE